MYGNLIGGAWTTTGTRFENRNPADPRDLVGEFLQADEQEARRALAAARTAFEEWQFSGPQTRFDILDKVGDIILARRNELGDLLAREEGKSLPEAIGEAARAGAIFKYFAGEALRNAGEVLDSVRPGVKVEVTREPLGVIAAITPWNFPLAIPAWKIAPALAFGNCVILKPAEIAPACAWKLSEILHDAGIPPGVFNLVMGRGSQIGPVLCAGADGVTFTGSSAVGAGVRAAASGRVQLEMGGKNPLLVVDDADLHVAVNCAVQGAFFSTGQRCTASSRIIVTKGIHGRFVEALSAATAALRVGDPRAANVQIGPVASRAQYETVLGYIEVAKSEGARLVVGGEPIGYPEDGFFIQPTLFDGTTPEMTINREEIFGPVASILMVDDFESGIAAVNDTEYGLVAGICTTSLRHAEQFKRRAQAGMTMVNLPTAGVDYHVPFGGRKSSSYGPREQGTHARDFYTIVKTSYQAA